MKPMVLVVEDDAEVAEITARMLEDAGYQSGWTKTDREAIAIVSNMQIAVSLLIIDLTLPDKPGFEVARLARQSRPSPPIVFTSGYPRYREVPPEFEEAPFLAKPYSLDELVAVVQRLLPSETRVARPASPTHPG